MHFFLDDFDELLATLNQPSWIAPKNSTTSSNQPAPVPTKVSDNGLLGDYMPSLSQTKQTEKRQTMGRPSSQPQTGVDELLKIFEDDQNLGSKAALRGKSQSELGGGLKAKEKQQTVQSGQNLFDGLDFDDEQTKELMGKPTFETKKIDLGSTMRKEDDSVLKEKRATLFGLANKGGPRSSFDNYSGSSNIDIQKDPFFTGDQMEDFPKQKEVKQPLMPTMKVGLSKSKSLIDGSDDFPTIDISQSRRPAQRNMSVHVSREDKSNSPPGQLSSSKRSFFDENFGKPSSICDDDLDLGAYNPSLSRLPSRKSVKDTTQGQRPPRLMKSHDDGFGDSKEQPAKETSLRNKDYMFGDRSQFQEKSTVMYSERNDLFGETSGTNFRGMGNRLNLNNGTDDGLREFSNETSLQGTSQGFIRKTSGQEKDYFEDANRVSTGGNRNRNYQGSKQMQDAPVKYISYAHKTGDGKDSHSLDQPSFIQTEPKNAHESFRKDSFQKENDSFQQERHYSLKDMEDTKRYIQEESKRQIQEESTQQMAVVRNNYETQLRLLRENHEEQLRHEKKIRDQLMEQMQAQFQAEKDRIRILHDSEIKSKDQAFECEKQQLTRTFQAESDMLKRQIEQQVKMTALAEEIRLNADKLNSIQNKFEGSHESNSNQDAKLKEREQQIHQLERKIGIEQDFIENDKIKLHKAREELEQREAQMRIEIDTEKAILRKEYNRLSELQEVMNQQEQDKKRHFLIEKQELDNEKTLTQDESLKLKQEYQEAYKDFEMEISLFEKQKTILNVQSTKLEAMLKQKITQVDEIRQRLFEQEAFLIKRQKAVEIKELEVNRREMECKNIYSVTHKERTEFEVEEKKIHEYSKRVQKEQEKVAEFMNQFQSEREKLERLQTELNLKERKIQQDTRLIETEKRDIKMMQKTLQSLKRETVKEFQMNDDISFLSRKENVNTSNINMQNHARASSLHQPKQDGTFLQDLSGNSLANCRLFTQTNVAFPKKQSEKIVDMFMRKPPLEKKEFLQAQMNQPQLYQAIPSIIEKQFNLNDFMNELKVIDQTNHFNQAYISKERENLLIKNNIGSEYSNSQNQNSKSGSYSQSQFCDSSPYIKPSNSSSFQNQ